MVKRWHFPDACSIYTIAKMLFYQADKVFLRMLSVEYEAELM